MDNSGVFSNRVNDLYQYVQHSLTFSEAKNGSLLALSVATLAVILSIDTDNDCQKWLLYLILIPLLIGFAISFVSFYPVKKKKDKLFKSDDSNLNIFHCENIVKMGRNAMEAIVLSDLGDYKPTLYEEQKVDNIFNMAKAASRKYKLFRIALCWFLAFIILFGAYLIFTLINPL